MNSVATDLAPKADHILSQAIIAGEFVFVSGQVHTTADSTLVQGSTEDKVRQIMHNIAEILKAAGSAMNQVVNVVVYITDMSIMPELNSVYPTYFSEPFPARTAVCVKELPLGASIEISVVAAV